MNPTKSEILQAVAVASAGYFAANPMPLSQVDTTIRAFVRALTKATSVDLRLVENQPAVAYSETIAPGRIACLECGKKMRSLKLHLRNMHGISPEEYRLKWGLLDSYPMMAPEASALRSETSKQTQVRVQADPNIRKGGRPRVNPRRSPLDKT